ncbi:hypothetical protein V6N13_144947 [Hibiscus sabdariffa]
MKTIRFLTRHLSTSTPTSKLRDHYSFQPPPYLSSDPQKTKSSPNPNKKQKPRYRPPSSLDQIKPKHSDLPFDFRFSYTESSPSVRPIGLREPKYSPFGPGRLDREWTGVCAPAVDPKVKSVEGTEDPELEAKRKLLRGRIQGAPLTEAERKYLVEKCQRNRTKRQINLGRDGLTHNMLNDIHNHWKFAEAVRIKCLGVPTVDMKNVCTQLEDKTFGKVIQRQGGTLILYRGRNYNCKNRPEIPLMLWKPQEPVYPRLIKTTIDGLSIEETKEMRKRGLAVHALTKLAKNGYYSSLVPMVRDAFLVSELVRIDCTGLEKSDYKKIGCKLRDLVPCILVTFEKKQIVVWRGKDSKPPEDGDGEFFDDPSCDMERSETYREPCPDRILDDIGGAFGMGVVGGAAFHFIKGTYNSPGDARLIGGTQAVRMNAPRVGGSFAVWGGLFSTFDCTMVYLRQKDNPWNSIIAGAAMVGLLSMRQGLGAASRSAAFCGVLLALIEGVDSLTQGSSSSSSPSGSWFGGLFGGGRKQQSTASSGSKTEVLESFGAAAVPSFEYK